MSSRQEEKEQRKQERLERERAAAAASKRKRLLGIIGGVFVAAAIIVGIVLATRDSADKPPTDDKLKQVAQAAGCTYGSFKDEGREHLTSDTETFDGYKTNPPTSGTHRPTPGQDGLYAAGNEPDEETWVHTLEHGRILLMYKPDAPKAAVDGLAQVFKEPVLKSAASYHMAMLRNNTKMPFEVAAVAWRHYMGCKEYSPKVLPALRAFRDARVDKAPEFVP